MDWRFALCLRVDDSLWGPFYSRDPPNSRKADPEGRQPIDTSTRDAARRIDQSALVQGLFAYTSMFDLDILEREVSYPYDGPFLRLS